jgi:hypothetical protein
VLIESKYGRRDTQEKRLITKCTAQKPSATAQESRVRYMLVCQLQAAKVELTIAIHTVQHHGFLPVKKSAHAVVPQLDDAIVQGGQDPWPDRMEAQAFDAIALAFELSKHLSRSLALPVQLQGTIPAQVT